MNSAKKILFVIFSLVFVANLLATPVSALVKGEINKDTIFIDGKEFKASSKKLSDQNEVLYVNLKLKKPIEAVLVNKNTNKSQLISFEIVNDKITNKKIIDDVELKTKDDLVSDCQIPVIGWFACGVVNGLSGAVDWLNEVLINDLLNVEPIVSNDNSLVYIKYWQLIRDISNFIFIAMFLIIIFSHLTGIAISNYHIKTMLPKIIIYAVLVNLSFYLAGMAIDISNIVGNSAGQLLSNLGQQVTAEMTWEAAMGLIFGGGGAIIGGLILVGIPGLNFGFWILAPVLIGALIALGATVFTLLARKVIIITLAVISPLALVANLLPNTSNYFKKYLELFKQMLLVFPIYSIMFGLAKLLGKTMMAGSDGKISFINLILGMIIQLVPIFFLSKLVTFSNEMLGKIYNSIKGSAMVKGVQDLANNHANLKKEEASAIYSGGDAKKYQLSRRMTQAFQKDKQRIEENTKLYNAMSQNKYLEAKGNSRDSLFAGKGLYQTKMMEEKVGRQTARYKNVLKDSIIREMAKETEDKDRIDGILNKKGQLTLSQQLAKEAVLGKLTEERVAKDESVHNKRLFENVLQNSANINMKELGNENALAYAAGLLGKKGETVLLAEFFEKNRKGLEELLSSTQSTFSQYNLTNDEKAKLAFGQSIGTKIDAKGREMTFDPTDDVIRMAAMKSQFAFQDSGFAEKVLQGISGDFTDSKGNMIKSTKAFASFISEQLASSGTAKENTEYHYAFFDQIISDGFELKEARAKNIMSNIKGGRLNAATLSQSSKDSVQNYLDWFKNNKEDFTTVLKEEPAMIVEYHDKVAEMLSSPELSANLKTKPKAIFKELLLTLKKQIPNNLLNEYGDEKYRNFDPYSKKD